MTEFAGERNEFGRGMRYEDNLGNGMLRASDKGDL